jgi:tripartite-type tricarboxylate transporter receptor subunit TctC
VLRDFTPISLIETSPSRWSPAHAARKGLKEFIALRRSQPGKLSYGTIGAGRSRGGRCSCSTAMAA